MEEINIMQNRLLEMAKKIAEILEKNDIPYILSYGSLIGAVRHKGFIPWDDDFDFSLFNDSYDKAISVLKEELPEDMFVEYFDTEPKYFHAYAHIKDINTIVDFTEYPQDGMYEHKGLSIDLYKITKLKREDVEEFKINEAILYFKRRRKINSISENEYNFRIYDLEKKREELIREPDKTEVYTDMFDVFREEQLFPLKKCKFEDAFFYVPNDYDSVLKGYYGNYMELPPEEKRKPHYSNIRFLKGN